MSDHGGGRRRCRHNFLTKGTSNCPSRPDNNNNTTTTSSRRRFI